MRPARIKLIRRVAATTALVVAVAAPVVALSVTSASADNQVGARSGSEWLLGGHDLGNTRSNSGENLLNATNVRNLGTKWTAGTPGQVSATPAVAGGAVYFPDWAGNFTKLNASTGQVIWTKKISDITGVSGNYSRTSPAISGNLAIIGDQGGTFDAGARLLAFNLDTGALAWSKVVDSHPRAQITQSPTVHNGVVYQGISSMEEEKATDPGYVCCTFRGSLVAVRASSGQQVWRTYTVPPNNGQTGGYSGNAIWGGTPAIDPAAGRVYVTTGNNYTVPQEVKDCQEGGGTPSECMSPDNRLNSIIAFDLNNGAIKWSAGPERFDDWNGGCLPGQPPGNCPQNPGADWDFGDGPHLFTARINGQTRKLVGAGQKSGEFWTVDASNGNIVWSSAPGPGGWAGGIMWGAATDNKRIYVAEANAAHLSYTLPNGQTINYGSFAALDPATGAVLWQVPDPTGGTDTAAVSVANGVMYAGATNGNMYAFDAANGRLLWSTRGTGPVNAGPAIAGGRVYWGNGYPDRQVLPPVPSPSTFYSFGLPGA